MIFSQQQSLKIVYISLETGFGSRRCLSVTIFFYFPEFFLILFSHCCQFLFIMLDKLSNRLRWSVLLVHLNCFRWCFSRISKVFSEAFLYLDQRGDISDEFLTYSQFALQRIHLFVKSSLHLPHKTVLEGLNNIFHVLLWDAVLFFNICFRDFFLGHQRGSLMKERFWVLVYHRVSFGEIVLMEILKDVGLGCWLNDAGSWHLFASRGVASDSPFEILKLFAELVYTIWSSHLGSLLNHLT